MLTAIIKPGEFKPEPLVHNEPLTLEQFQEIVGGFIEVVQVKDTSGGNHDMVLNEEGKLQGLPYNHIATLLYANSNDVIMGTVAVLIDWELE